MDDGMEMVRQNILSALAKNEAERFRLEQLLAVADADPGKAPKLPSSMEYVQLGVAEAARKYLEEVKAATTREIVDALLSRGVKTKSKDFLNNVFSSLSNRKGFERKGHKWQLKK